MLVYLFKGELVKIRTGEFVGRRDGSIPDWMVDGGLLLEIYWNSSINRLNRSPLASGQISHALASLIFPPAFSLIYFFTL